MVDVVDHLPISRSRGRFLRCHKRAAPPYSGTRTVDDDDVLSPFQRGSGCGRSSGNPSSTTAWWWRWRIISCRASPSLRRRMWRWRMAARSGRGGGNGLCFAPGLLSYLYRGGGRSLGLPQPLGPAHQGEGGKLAPQVHLLFLRDSPLSIGGDLAGWAGVVRLAHQGWDAPPQLMWPLPGRWAHMCPFQNLLETLRLDTGKFPNFSETRKVTSHI